MLTMRRTLAIGLAVAATVGAGAFYAQPSQTGIWRSAASGARLKPGTVTPLPPEEASLPASKPMGEQEPSTGFTKAIRGRPADVYDELDRADGDIEIVTETRISELPRHFDTVEDELDSYVVEGRGIAIVYVSALESELRGGVLPISQVTVQINEVLNNTAGYRLRTGESVRLEIDGGEFKRGGKRAVVRDVRQRMPEVGRHYLWTFFDCGSSVCSADRDYVLQLDGGKAKRLGTRNEGPVGRTINDADAILAALRSRANRPGGLR